MVGTPHSAWVVRRPFKVALMEVMTLEYSRYSCDFNPPYCNHPCITKIVYIGCHPTPVC